MMKNKKKLSQREAQAFKTKAEGQAALITALAPIIIAMLAITAFCILLALGVDPTPLLSALTPLLAIPAPNAKP